jgi:NADH dehydrogenase
MPDSDIVIIGGGFAGLEAARLLSKKISGLSNRRVIVVDAKKTFDFLPVLPDVAGGRIRKSSAVLDLADYIESLRVNFELDEVVRVDTGTKEVFLKSGGVLSYEFLVIACGSVTNFYGMDDVARRSLKLDTAEDAVVLQNVVTTYSNKKIVIVGGGYTGIEIATNLASLLRRKKIKKYSIHVIERAEDILSPLPEWMRDYCRVNLSRLRVNFYTECSIEEVSDQRVKLSNGMVFEDYVLVWAAGVVMPPFMKDLKFDKDKQGRLIVNEHMMFSDHCFAVGDAAAFKHGNSVLRMAVQFSVMEARVAVANILKEVKGVKRLAKYHPIDLGLLVPMANKKACGKVFIFRVSGFFGWFLHYVMCIYRSLSLENKLGIFGDAFTKIGR